MSPQVLRIPFPSGRSQGPLGKLFGLIKGVPGETWVRWLDRLIVALVFLTICLLGLRAWNNRSAPMPPLPQPFAIPATIQARQPPPPGQSIHEALRLSPQTRSLGEVLLKSGSLAFNRGDFPAAIQAFTQAKALLPGHPAPLAGLAQIDRKVRSARIWTDISRDAAEGNLPQAWEKFSAATRHNLPFFLDYAPQFASVLEERGEAASAAAILMTFCQLRPQAQREHNHLRELGKRFAQEN
ncbi:MAG: hypothetical protein GX442_06495 [Candidatus Riflebacteria bacterium]|nr:hypothetical protein [Candidatus Riflebacteria bacterium]